MPSFRLFRRDTVPAALLGASLAVGAAPGGAAAQTDYYNTDAARPVRVEDALPVERYAFELQLAPLRLERTSGGVYHWEVEPEVAYGVLPRTQLEASFPLALEDAGGEGQTSGLAGVEVSALHNLNTETSTLPALAVAAGVLLPVGGLAPAETYASLKAIATRTFHAARVHLNGEYTFGADPAEGEEAGEVSRWMAGVAVDRAFPLRSALLTGDLFVEQPLDPGGPAWTVEAGVRYQLSPQYNVDFGVGRRLTGDEPGWFFTFGTAHAFAVRSLLPLR